MKKSLKKIIRKGSGIVALSLIGYAALAKGPSGEYLRAAENYYNSGDYYSAANYYEKFLLDSNAKSEQYSPYVVQRVSKKVMTNPATRKEIVYKLAESYRLLHYYSKAEPYYKEAMDLGIYPLAAYWYGKTLKADDKAAEAEVAFNEFLKNYTTPDEFSKDATMELQNIRFSMGEIKKKDLYKFKVDKMDAAVNQPGASYASFIMGDGSVVFTSTRSDSGASDSKSNPHTNKLIKASITDKTFTDQQKVQLTGEKGWEQGVAAFTPDGNKMFVTRWASKNGKKMSAIYSADKTGTGWSAPAKLGDMVNTDSASSQQPFITTDGKWLLFSSDKAGGSGKFDLWMAPLDASFTPSAAATNLGSSINTDGDDEAPFYHQPSQTLVYATNGKTGMGGLDLFYSKGNFATWEAPKNMGYPVNSIKDDVYYTSSDKKSIWNNAFLSSDRNSPCCLELYVFDKIKTSKTISGTVVDCEGKSPVPNAAVSITAADGTKISKTTDASGKYTLTMEDFQALKVEASAQGYNSNSLTVAAPDDMEKDMLSASELCLNKPVKVDTIPVNVAVLLDNVLYDFAKSTLKTASYPSLDKLVDLMNANPGMAIELSSHTDNIGSDTYNMTLSEKRAEACVKYLVSKGIDKSRIEAKGYGETTPVAPNTVNGKDNPKGRQQNRRTEFKILHY